MLKRVRVSVLTVALATGACMSLPGLAAAQTMSPEAQAQMRFTRGRDLFNAHNYDQALVEFRAAQSAVGSPNIRLYIARTLRELGHVAEAYVEFTRTNAEASDRSATEARYTQTRDAAHAEAQELEARIGRLTIHVPTPPPGVEVHVGTTNVVAAGWDIPTPFDPGGVDVTATAPGMLPFRQRVTVEATHDAQVTVRLAVDPNARRNAGAGGTQRRERVGGEVRTAGFVVGSLGVAGGIAFAILGSMAQSSYGDIQRMCPMGCGSEIDPQIANGESLQTGANIALIGGGVALAAGVVMILVGGPREVVRTVPANGSDPPARTSATHAAPPVALWGGPVGTHGGLVGLGTTF